MLSQSRITPERSGAAYPPRKKRKDYRGYGGKRRIVLKAWEFWSVKDGEVVARINLLLGGIAKESETK